MKQTIEIEVPEGKTAVLEGDKIVFKDIKPQLPNTWEEFCKIYSNISESEYYINGYATILNRKVKNYGSRRKIEVDKNTLPTKEAAEAHLALMQLHQLRDCYRQGWKPDWNDYNQEKYILEFKETSPVSESYTSPYFLAFQSKEITEKFKANFIDLIKQAGDLIYI